MLVLKVNIAILISAYDLRYLATLPWKMLLLSWTSLLVYESGYGTFCECGQLKFCRYERGHDENCCLLCS
jgi:hypothetical protein